MGCRSKPKCRPTIKSKKKNTQDIEWYDLDELEEIGRKQFFWHYPHSKLPIRDITQKTEPHIEIGAENYLRSCIQSNVSGFHNSYEKYLFLTTECKNKEFREFYCKRFVVGYIEKKGWKKMNDDQIAVYGNTYIVPFDNELNYKNLGFMGRSYTKKLNKKETKKLLNLIKKHKNIKKKCIQEMIEMEDIERGNSEIPIDNECLGRNCTFKHECLRRKMK